MTGVDIENNRRSLKILNWYQIKRFLLKEIIKEVKNQEGMLLSNQLIKFRKELHFSFLYVHIKEFYMLVDNNLIINLTNRN